jgi:molybdate transport system substrate-binding protein
LSSRAAAFAARDLLLKIVAIIAVFLAALTVQAEELSVAAAADLNFALNVIATRYQHDSGNTLQISYGSSGNFFTQIQNGAPFDLFFSADMDFPRQLEAAGLAEPGTLYRYATGKIVLWVPNGSKLDLSRGINVLLDASIKKIAIANPRHAPYGRVAEAALRKAGIYDRVQSKLVLGENISQTAQFVETGNAEIGILALSLATSPTMKSRGRYVEVPSDLYPPLQQGVVILKSSRKKDAAKQFLEYLKRPATQEILHRYGFQ